MYVCTNESLSAIIKGLDVNSKDTVLAIGGSGDQAFALLEYANKVDVVDDNSIAIDFIKKRTDFLKNGKINEFLYSDVSKNVDSFPDGVKNLKFDVNNRNAYFLQDERLALITSRLDDLTIIQGDVFQVATEKEYSKIYLSNALGFRDDVSIKLERDRLRNLSKKLKEDHLIYVSNHDELIELFQSPLSKLYFELFKDKFLGKIFGCYEDSFLPSNLKVDKCLTSKARIEDANSRFVLNGMYPAVYRKAK